MSLLSVGRLAKTFSGRPLLDVSGLVFEAGSLYVLSGDNGAGKTTLLRILAGLAPADEFHFRFDGGEFTGREYPAWLRRKIIYVHQHPYLFNTGIKANIAYGLRVRDVDAALREHAVLAAIEWAGVAHLSDVPPGQLSGGEKQRVALARAKVLEPRVLLVDEPAANLDSAARAQVLELLRQTTSDNNCVVVACHDREMLDLPGVKRLHIDAGRVTAV
jgi:tungstate transport system ATP-binding protein